MEKSRNDGKECGKEELKLGDYMLTGEIRRHTAGVVINEEAINRKTENTRS